MRERQGEAEEGQEPEEERWLLLKAALLLVLACLVMALAWMLFYWSGAE